MNIRTTLYIMTALLAVSCGRKTGDGPTVSRFDGFTQGTTYHILVKSDGPLHMENEIDSLFSAGGTTALLSQVSGLDDFELICFLVVK